MLSQLPIAPQLDVEQDSMPLCSTYLTRLFCLVQLISSGRF